jgi:hypothetical protein
MMIWTTLNWFRITFSFGVTGAESSNFTAIEIIVSNHIVFHRFTKAFQLKYNIKDKK